MTGPYRRLRPDGAIPTSTKTISFTGCRFDLAQFADAEAAGSSPVGGYTSSTTWAPNNARRPRSDDGAV
jgi:hypothetical protein